MCACPRACRGNVHVSMPTCMWRKCARMHAHLHEEATRTRDTLLCYLLETGSLTVLKLLVPPASCSARVAGAHGHAQFLFLRISTQVLVFAR